jgi:hypothetical protein
LRGTASTTTRGAALGFDLALSAQEAVAEHDKSAMRGEEDLISIQRSMIDIPRKHQKTPKIHSGVVVFDGLKQYVGLGVVQK